MATEIANAYIALYTKLPGVENDITKALGGSAVQNSVAKAGEGMGSQLMAGMNKIGKAGAIALGTTIAVGLGTALVKGFQRLDALDQAEAKLTGLGHSTESVAKIMENALASVKGTAFGMGDAATVAASVVAAGVKPGQDLERTLKLVGDAATIAGTDLSTMGSIVNKVATSDMMQMDVANQLMDAGIPILQLLGESMGVTADEARKLASAGQVSFEDFQTALEAGLGGAALESGNTFSGAMDNVMASIGRVGEGLLSGLFPEMKDGLKGLIDALKPLEDVARDVGAAIGGFIGWVKENINWLGPLAQGIMIAVGALIALNVIMWILSINPITLLIMAIVLAVGLLIGAIILLVQNWDMVVAWITEVWTGFVTWIMEVLNGFVAWWNGIWAAVGNFISTVWNNIVNWISNAVNNVVSFVTDAVNNISNAWNSVWTGIGNFLKDTWNNILGWIEGGVNGAIDLINGMTGGIRDVLAVVGIEIGEIPHVNIPRLAAGGIVKAQSGGILANIGEGRYDEAVLPLSPAILGQLGGSGQVTQNNTINMIERDPRLVARQLGRELKAVLA